MATEAAKQVVLRATNDGGKHFASSGILPRGATIHAHIAIDPYFAPTRFMRDRNTDFQFATTTMLPSLAALRKMKLPSGNAS